jgi:hypothetical protein
MPKGTAVDRRGPVQRLKSTASGFESAHPPTWIKPQLTRLVDEAPGQVYLARDHRPIGMPTQSGLAGACRLNPAAAIHADYEFGSGVHVVAGATSPPNRWSVSTIRCKLRADPWNRSPVSTSSTSIIRPLILAYRVDRMNAKAAITDKPGYHELSHLERPKFV